MANSSSKRRGEFALIGELFAPLAGPGAYGLTDDAATVALAKGHELVVTTDAVVEGVHFLSDDPPETIGRKALRVNLSDLAAKGAAPLGYLLVLSLPKYIGFDWLKKFAKGLAKDQREFGIALLGGDTTATPGPLTIAITALGTIPKSRMIRRKGAKPGDLVFVSGTIGDAGAALALLKRKAKEPRSLIARYRMPVPRLALGLALRDVASAGIDVSDGLLADLGHIADVAGVRITVDVGRLPLSRAFRAWGGKPTVAATAGDDYEIAFTAPARKLAAVARAAVSADTPVALIGRVVRGEGVALLDASGREIAVKRRGFTHF
ncbi:MAG TPA: thiamine-phosphate kinase [Rhizomicrobium sp.]|nr:thiamine-phosphate kinase [Rhizomicrobium sp.]